MDQSTHELPVRRKRWISLSVRGTLILVLVLGVLLGGMTRRAGRQRRAVATIEALGGDVAYDWQAGSTLEPFLVDRDG